MTATRRCSRCSGRRWTGRTAWLRERRRTPSPRSSRPRVSSSCRQSAGAGRGAPWDVEAPSTWCGEGRPRRSGPSCGACCRRPGCPSPCRNARGMAQYSVSRTWKEADFRISFAKMRSNPVDAATLSVSNLEGLGPRHDQFFFAERQAHRDTATMMLLDEFPPHFALIDAYDRASDGLLGMMGNPRPKVPRRLYAAADPIALDMI